MNTIHDTWSYQDANFHRKKPLITINVVLILSPGIMHLSEDLLEQHHITPPALAPPRTQLVLIAVKSRPTTSEPRSTSAPSKTAIQTLGLVESQMVQGSAGANPTCPFGNFKDSLERHLFSTSRMLVYFYEFRGSPSIL